MKYEFYQPRFSEGVLAKSLQGRSSEDFYKFGMKGAKNMLPVLAGPVVKRPGTNYIGELKDPSAILIPFFKDKNNTYVIEIGQTHASDASGGYLRLWSQDQLLKDKQGTPATYEVTLSSTVAWTRAQLATLKYTQSGDYIFVCCPTKVPQIIKRVIDTTATGTGVAADDSIWTVYEYEMIDGPYKEINVYSEDAASTEKYALYIAEPTNKEFIAGVEFNTVTNNIVLANHGLQTGMKIRLDDDDTSTQWGNITSDGSTVLADADYYVVSTTATTFQISTEDGGTPLEFELKSGETKANADIKLYRYVYPASETGIVFTLYKDGAVSDDLFSDDDVGRMIRINPLARPLLRIGGIRWAWGIISAQGTNTVTVKLKTEMANIRGGTDGSAPSQSSSETRKRGTPDFRLGAFSKGEGFPSVSQIYQQRMVLGATSLQPSTVWLSKTGNFYSFAPTDIPSQDSPSSVSNGEATEIITATSALTFTLDSDTLDEIKWLAESKKLTMGTSAGVYMLYGSETNLVVTPFRFTINRESSFSATDTPPVVVSNALMYTQIGGKDVQQLLFEGQQGQWFNSKISIKGYDVIKTSTIQKMVWQERPNNVIWMMMDDGRLLSLSYDRQTSFQAWSEHVISGTNAKVTDIEMIATESHDQIWLKVERTINGSTKYYMETLARYPTEGALARNALVFSDSALTKNIAGKAFTVSSSSGLLVTSASHGLIDTQRISVSNSGGALPTGLAVGEEYYVRDKTDNTFKLALSSGGTAIAYTNAGTGTHSWATKQVTGLAHLEGESLQVYYDGMQHINKTVSSGSVILENTAGTDVVIGLPYNGEIETLDPTPPPNQYSYTKRLLSISLLIEESLGIQIEYTDLLEDILFRSTGDMMGQQIPLFSGSRKLSLSGIGWDQFGLKIVSNGPFPMQINSLVLETETGGS